MSDLAALRRARLDARREYRQGTLTRQEYQRRAKLTLYDLNREIMRQAGAADEDIRLLLGPEPPRPRTEVKQEPVSDYYSMRLSRLRQG